MCFSSPAGSGVPKLLGVLVETIEGVLPLQTFSKVSALVLVVFILFLLFYYEGVLPWHTFSKVSALVLLLIIFFILSRGIAPLADILTSQCPSAITRECHYTKKNKKVTSLEKGTIESTCILNALDSAYILNAIESIYILKSVPQYV